MKKKIIFLFVISLVITSGINAQSKTKGKKVILKGIVLDTENNPIQTASIFINGKRTDVKSDEEGRFHIKLKKTTKSITVFTLDHGGVEFVYNGEEEMTFVLNAADVIEEDPLNTPVLVEENVIHDGLGSKTKRELGTGVGEIDENRLKRAYQYTTIYDLIAGEVAGVRITSNNRIIIRGASSLIQNNGPYLVVDGVPVSNLDHIYPTQVKSVSVLKGTAAAIYGLKGANGVVVITLKKHGDD